MAAAPIHGGFLWWLALAPGRSDSLEFYGSAALALGALRILFFGMAARWLHLSPWWRGIIVALSVVVVVRDPAQCSEPFTQATAMAGATLAATIRAIETRRVSSAALAGGLAGLTFATHLPAGFLLAVFWV